MPSASERLVHRVRLVAVSLLFSILSVASAEAQIYNAAADFSATSNPNEVWRYGYLAPGLVPDPTTFTVYPEPFKAANTDPPNTVDGWRVSSEFDPPSVTHNGTATPATEVSITWASGQLAFHPGPNGEYSIVRWTAPIEGTYSMAVTFTGIDAQPTSTDVHILHNSSALFNGIVDDYQIPHVFSTTRSVAAGDTLDFVVGLGPNGNHLFDTTALDVTITQQEAAPCMLQLAHSATKGTLTLHFQLGTQEPATWNVWLTAQTDVIRLLSFPLSPIDPPAQVPITIPFFPTLGTIGVLTTLTTSDQGIICSDFATMGTGPIEDSSASTLQELRDRFWRSSGQ